jgi:hypothetical protein
MSKLGSNWEVRVLQCYLDKWEHKGVAKQGLQIADSDCITINEIKNKNDDYNYRTFSEMIDFINYDDEGKQQYYIVEIHKYEVGGWYEELERNYIGNIKFDPRTKDVNEYYESDLLPKLPKYIQKALLEWFKT